MLKIRICILCTSLAKSMVKGNNYYSGNDIFYCIIVNFHEIILIWKRTCMEDFLIL